MMVISANNEDFAHRFVPCAAAGLLLQTSPATVKCAVLAQKVLLLRQWLGNQVVLSCLRRHTFMCNLMNNDFKTPGVFTRETFGRETQQYKYNLATKGRN